MASLATVDLHLLDRVRSLWMLGDYSSLASIEIAHVRDHPQAGLIAVHIAAGLERVSDQPGLSQTWYALAQDWGCPSAMLLEFAMANLHISLAELHELSEDSGRAHVHLKASVLLTCPWAPTDRIAQGLMQQLQRENTHSPPIHMVARSEVDIARCVDGLSGNSSGQESYDHES